LEETFNVSRVPEREISFVAWKGLKLRVYYVLFARVYVFRKHDK